MTRYSETVSDELKDKVLRIQAQHVSDFKSCAFEVLEDMGDELTVCRWIRAQKDEEEDCWIVREHQTAPYLANDPAVKASDVRNMPTESRILMHRACFLDALSACASFETMEREKGKSSIGDSIEEIGIKHYKNAAEEEGIPFDLTSGLPVPIANGIILTEKAALPPISEEFEERSKGNMIRKEQLPALSLSDAIGQEIDVPENFKTGASSAKELITTSTTSLREVESDNHKKMKAVTALKDKFNDGSRKGFRDIHLGCPEGFVLTTVFGGAATGCVSLLHTFPYMSAWLALPLLLGGITTGIIGAGAAFVTVKAGLIDEKQWPVEFPMRKFNKSLAKVRKNIEQISNETDKQKAMQATNKLELYAYAIRAYGSIVESEDVDVGSYYTKRMKRDLDKLEEKAKELGMPEGDIEKLLLSLKNHKNTDPKKIIGKQFADQIKSIAQTFENEKEAQISRLPSPLNR